MITKNNLEKIINELLPGRDIAQFSEDWILAHPKTNEGSIKKVYAYLKNKGLKDEKIASQAKLLAMNPDTIERNYQRLSALGLKDKKIASYANLLGKDPDSIERNYQRLSALGLKDKKIATHIQLLAKKPETIERNYQRLSALGLKDKKIASCPTLLGRDPDSIERNYKRLSSLGLKDKKITTCASLLGRDPETIERNYQRLSALGLKDKKIASCASLLSYDPETVKRNYQNCIKLFRQNYQDRSSGRDLLAKRANLLGNSLETINVNIQFLNSAKIDYNKNILLLGTKAELKREKMAWMLRELFDYRIIPQEQRRSAIYRAYDFVRKSPIILTRSIGYMEKNKSKLREKAKPYRI